ncbi:MAG: metallophosphoesterase [Pyrinomonadaceae bacterium]
MLKKIGLSLFAAFCLTGATLDASAQTPKPVNANSIIGNTTRIQNPGVVSWVHIGDLHITSGDAQNYADFQTIIKNTNQYLLNGINFAVLPGDNANEGSEAEYQLIKAATDNLQAPLYAVPGDHDLKGGDLSLFTKYMETVPYQSFSADRYHFVFVDALDASGRGGFGIGQEQMNWLTKDLDAAAQKGLQSVLFMHAFPGKVGESGGALQSLIAKDRVLMVDVGHTHYNEVANDGHTIYAATRSTGQASEGPVGFSITNLDNGVVSWKFKPLGSFPFVMITSPADKQLITDPTQSNQVVKGTVEIRSKVWDDKGIASATYQIDNGTPQPLARIGASQMWSARWNSAQATDGNHQITVTAQGAGGSVSSDKIYIVVSQTGNYQAAQQTAGADGNSIGAYAEKGLLGSHAAGGGPVGKDGRRGPGENGGKGGGPGGAPPEDQTALAKEAKITMEQARAIAVGKLPGAIENGKLEHERGILQYSFDIRTAEGNLSEVEVNAADGSIVAVEQKKPKGEGGKDGGKKPKKRDADNANAPVAPPQQP